jgi:hypothetical protein
MLILVSLKLLRYPVYHAQSKYLRMKNFYILRTGCFALLMIPLFLKAQPCASLGFTYTAAESRCVSTGSFAITATGGSGQYNYRVTGTMSTPYTSSSVITGLKPGSYTITVKDVATGCIKTKNNCIITGNYLPPNFSVTKTNETCMGANNGTITVTNAVQGRSPFTYTIIAPSPSNVGVTSTAGVFTGLTPGNYLVQQKDSCGNIQTRGVSVLPYTWWIQSHTVAWNCGVINVSITLRDNLGNTSGHPIFSGFRYGVARQPGDTVWFTTASFSLSIGNRRMVDLVVKDGCGNIQKKNWVNNNRPSVSASVTTQNLLCSTFTARVTGQTNLTNPVYCIYNNANVQLACNSTGVFAGLAYGSYCIRITDACYDTTITRCFTQNKPAPSVAANVTISNINCNGFTATVTGWSNLFNPQFCLFRMPGNVLISCNNTGVFTNIPFGSYCIYIRDAGCTDTVLTRCFTVQRPIPSAGPPVSFIRFCSNYTMQLTDTANLSNPQFCLYSMPGNVLVECNTTGVFTGLIYGQRYCIQTQNSVACYDTAITHCFILNRAVPSANSQVQISNKNCSTFTAAVNGLVNISNPEFCIYNSANVLLGCNTTGVFTNLPYASYCIKIKNNPACYDTIITRCFSPQPDPLAFAVSATPSCSAGNTNIRVAFSTVQYPVAIRVYAPGGQLAGSTNSNISPVFINNLPPLPGGAPYKIVCTDACGRQDSALVTAVVSSMLRNIVVDKKCPSAVSPNGSNDITVSITSNLGAFTTTIIKKNNTVVNISFTTQTGNTSKFIDLEPAVYIFEHRTSGCTGRFYDTVTAGPYIFPQLQNAAIYQCDNNSFSAGASVQNGIGPFTYEIIGSVPATPSLLTPPQNSPVFNISNGTAYSLVRLRAVDVCGNAALNDANVLPLGNISSSQSSNCYYNDIVLSVDSMPNAVFTWYKKTGPNDSVLVATGTATYTIPYLLPTDTGRYVCRVNINGQCATRLVYFDVSGECDLLPLDVQLYGKRANGQNVLYWQDGQPGSIEQFVLERMTGGSFAAIATVAGGQYQYELTDPLPPPGNNLYRLKMKTAGAFTYSNLVMIKQEREAGISIFPNPATDVLHIRIPGMRTGRYQYSIVTATGAELFKSGVFNMQNGIVQHSISHIPENGLYYLRCTNLETGKLTVLPFMIHR